MRNPRAGLCLSIAGCVLGNFVETRNSLVMLCLCVCVAVADTLPTRTCTLPSVFSSSSGAITFSSTTTTTTTSPHQHFYRSTSQNASQDQKKLQGHRLCLFSRPPSPIFRRRRLLQTQIQRCWLLFLLNYLYRQRQHPHPSQSFSPCQPLRNRPQLLDMEPYPYHRTQTFPYILER